MQRCSEAKRAQTIAEKAGEATILKDLKQGTVKTDIETGHNFEGLKTGHIKLGTGHFKDRHLRGTDFSCEI